MMFFCPNCNSVFTHPIVIPNGDQSEVGYSPTQYCPVCSEESYFEEMDKCPKCGEYKKPNDRLCTNCTTTLKFKFRNFIDFLTAEEEEMLDDMLDGRSVTEI